MLAALLERHLCTQETVQKTLEGPLHVIDTLNWLMGLVFKNIYIEFKTRYAV